MQRKYQKLITDLVSHNFAVMDDFFPNGLLTKLKSELEELKEMDQLRRAKIGRDDTEQLQSRIRTDLTYWLGSKNSKIQKEYLTLMEKMRLELNKELFLALFYFEAHYAFYPVGAFYKKHFDSFKGSKNRMISMVTYLNHDWHEQDGGLLKLYDASGAEILSLLPEFGRMIIFLSEEVEHEVTLSRRERESIAGWFRCRELESPI